MPSEAPLIETQDPSPTLGEPSTEVVQARAAGSPEARIPHFFIVGAPRTGTTALYTYLRRSGHVFMPRHKEPHYFADDLPGISDRVDSLDSYLSLFEEAPPAALCGEASVYYLFSEVAAKRIREFRPDAKIVISLRNPVDLMYSLHAFNAVFIEDEPDFARALEREPDRIAGQPISPEADRVRFLLFYRRIASYPEQVQRYFDEFGTNRVHVSIFEEFQAEPERSFLDLCGFLGIPQVEGLEFEVVNPNPQLRSKWIDRLVKSPPGWLRNVGKAALPRAARTSLISWIWDFNVVRKPRPKLDASLRAQLIEDFRPQVQRLEKMLGRDLSVWSR